MAWRGPTLAWPSPVSDLETGYESSWADPPSPEAGTRKGARPERNLGPAAGPLARPARGQRWLGAMLLAALAAPRPAAAQTLRVTVTDSLSRAPLAGADVVAVDEAGLVRSGSSDTLGLATLALPHAGLYTVTARRLGFRASSPRAVAVDGDAGPPVHILLTRLALTLPSIDVAERSDRYLAQVGFYDRERLNSRSTRRSRTTTSSFGMPPPSRKRSRRRSPRALRPEGGPWRRSERRGCGTCTGRTDPRAAGGRTQ